MFVNKGCHFLHILQMPLSSSQDFIPALKISSFLDNLFFMP